MLARLEPYLTAAQAANLKRRIGKWQHQSVMQTQAAKTAAPSATLPILVMRPRSLPQTVDPFYFSLEPITTL